MSVSAAEIPAFFERYGWQYDRASHDLFRTGFIGDSGHYDIWVRLTDDWIYFAISPFLAAKKEGAWRPSDAVLELVLRSNYELNMAKFAVDEDGDIALSVELPTEGFVYSHFSDALTALSHYADDYAERFAAVTAVEGDEVV